MQTVLTKAIRVFHGHEDEIDDNERVAYLNIIKRVCNVNDWTNARIITNDHQIKCFRGVKGLTDSDRKKFNVYTQNWMKEKLVRTSGSNLKQKYTAIADYYKQHIFSYGVKYDLIEKKIKEIKRSAGLTASNTGEYGKCRLCGCDDKMLVINLNDNCGRFTFKHLVTEYCR
jgi:hypothetical protein